MTAFTNPKGRLPFPHALLVVLLLISTQVHAQLPERFHLKTLNYSDGTAQSHPLLGHRVLEYYPLDSIYILQTASLSDSPDVGIWSEWIPEEPHPSHPIKTVVYDMDFNFIGMLESKFNARIKAAGTHDNKVLLQGWNVVTSSFASISVNWTNDFPDSQVTAWSILEYDPAMNQLLEHVTHYRSAGSPSHWGDIPYDGYTLGTQTSSVEASSHYHTVTSGGHAVSGPMIFNSHTVNGNAYFNTTGQLGYLAIAYDLDNHNLSTVPVTPPGASLFNFKYFPSMDDDAFYRVGSFRGHASAINPGGTQMDGYPTDSSFVTYLSKENVEGEGYFATPLFGFNNVLPDTSSSNVSSAGQNIASLVEWEERMFVSQQLVIKSVPFPHQDTLFFTDFFGVEETHVNMLPTVVLEWEPYTDYMYAKNFIHVLSEQGEPLIELSMINGHEPLNAIATQTHPPLLFQVGEQLAWTTSYMAQTDTSLHLVRKYPGGEASDTTSVALPMGKGVCIFWLDSDLNLIDHWVIPYQSPDTIFPSVSFPNVAVPGLRGLYLEFIGAMNQDTLVLAGRITAGTTTGLDPSGDSPEVYYPGATTFIAFFANPTVGLEKAELQSPLNIYPNPTSSEIAVDVRRDAHFADYSVYDLAGKLVKSGELNPGNTTHKITLDPLASGMYILKCSGENGYATAKFAVH